MTVRDFMADVDARIFKSPIVNDVLVIGSTRIDGAFWREARELQLVGGGVQAVQISFDCRYVALIGRLLPGDLVQVEGHARFRFLREIVPGGDESGKTIIELGELKP